MDADIRIVRGNASAEELAVVTAVLLAAARTRAAAPAPEEAAGATILRWPGADRAHRPAGTWLTTPAPHWRHAA